MTKDGTLKSNDQPGLLQNGFPFPHTNVVLTDPLSIVFSGAVTWDRPGGTHRKTRSERRWSRRSPPAVGRRLRDYRHRKRQKRTSDTVKGVLLYF